MIKKLKTTVLLFIVAIIGINYSFADETISKDLACSGIDGQSEDQNLEISIKNLARGFWLDNQNFYKNGNKLYYFVSVNSPYPKSKSNKVILLEYDCIVKKPKYLIANMNTPFFTYLRNLAKKKEFEKRKSEFIKPNPSDYTSPMIYFGSSKRVVFWRDCFGQDKTSECLFQDVFTYSFNNKKFDVIPLEKLYNDPYVLSERDKYEKKGYHTNCEMGNFTDNTGSIVCRAFKDFKDKNGEFYEKRYPNIFNKEFSYNIETKVIKKD